MTDRELIELAVRAYIDESWHGDSAYMNGFISRWNPLVNDSDAFSLLVSMNMDVEVSELSVVVFCPCEIECVRVEQGFIGGKANTARLAITRAAAEAWRVVNDNADGG